MVDKVDVTQADRDALHDSIQAAFDRGVHWQREGYLSYTDALQSAKADILTMILAALTPPEREKIADELDQAFADGCNWQKEGNGPYAEARDASRQRGLAALLREGEREEGGWQGIESAPTRRRANDLTSAPLARCPDLPAHLDRRDAPSDRRLSARAPVMTDFPLRDHSKHLQEVDRIRSVVARYRGAVLQVVTHAQTCHDFPRDEKARLRYDNVVKQMHKAKALLLKTMYDHLEEQDLLLAFASACEAAGIKEDSE